MTPKPSKKVNFTEEFLRKLTTKPEHVGITYSDKGFIGLKARAATDHEVTFTVIRRVGGKKVPKKLGTYDPVHFTVEKARIAAGAQKFAIKNPKLLPRETKTLNQMIDYYAEQRLAGNSAIQVRKEDGLAEDWPAQAKKLRAMCKSILTRPIETLDAADIDKCKADHLRAIAKQKNKTVLAGTKLNDRPLRQACSALRQILQFAINLGWQETPILLACNTRKYKKRPRFLLPGEWQRIAAAIDHLPDNGGLLIRFLLATGARLNTALNMTWGELDAAQVQTSPPVREWRTRVKGEHEALIYLTGEALRVIDFFAEHKRLAIEKDASYKRDTVFTPEVIAMWRKHGTYYQRQLEAIVETSPFHRHDLRRTLATYLKYADLSQGFVSVALTHSFGTQENGANIEAAQATETYTNDDRITGDLLGGSAEDGNVDVVDMYEVVRAHVRVQTIFKHMEIGKRSSRIALIETKLRGGQKTNAMILQHKMNRSFLTVKSPEEHAAWVSKANLAEWGAATKVTLNKTLAAKARKQRLRSIAKQKEKANRVCAQNSGEAVSASIA